MCENIWENCKDQGGFGGFVAATVHMAATVRAG